MEERQESWNKSEYSDYRPKESLQGFKSKN